MSSAEIEPVQLLINGRPFQEDHPDLRDAIAHAYSDRQRPRCMCTAPGAQMYIARIGQTYLVKRMPGTGSQHAPACPSYEPPAELSGLDQVLGTAIVEDPQTGQTHLRLGFSMSRRQGGPAALPGAATNGSATSSGTRLSLRALLHYLWDQAELTKWRPGFEGRRTWAVVRRQLLQAAARKTACGRELLQQLYIPEPFFIEQRDAINTRRIAHWHRVHAGPSGTDSLILMIAELKEMGPARHGHRAVIKHLPDLPLSVDDRLYRSVSRRFEGELSLWGLSDSVRMVVIATISMGLAGTPALNEISLMTVNDAWVPVANAYEQQLVEHLCREGRDFYKPLSYNLPQDLLPASAILTDAGATPVLLLIQIATRGSNTGYPPECSTWRWDPSLSNLMPVLPAVPGGNS